jgi:hypothetical protein
MEDAIKKIYLEREKRVTDAIKLKIPDRVPVIAGMGYFPAKYTGITCETAWYDYDAWLSAYKATLKEFQPDMITVHPFTPGKVNEILQPRSTRWPGHGAPPDHGHQQLDLEFMKENEYDNYIHNYEDFMLRVNLPRTTGAAEGLEKLPPLSTLGTRGALGLAEVLIRPEVAKAIAQLQEAGREQLKWRSKTSAFAAEIENLGFPPYTQGGWLPPFDMVSVFLRGMKGSMLDMHRQPEKVIEACEFILSRDLARPAPSPNQCGNNRVFVACDRGSDDFMSVKQFEKFYWPTMKRMLLGIIDKGVTPCLFLEGNFTSKLEFLLELPAKKMLVQIDKSDIFRAKDILKGHSCIRGNVPSSLLQVGSVQEVKDYCKMLIDGLARDGGFILSPRSSTDEVKPENFKAMIDFTKEYGKY